MTQSEIAEMQSKLDTYAAVFSKIRENVKDDQAAALILQEVARDARAQQMREERQAERQARNGEPATPKQLDFLNVLEMPIPEGLTKLEASALIDKGKERRLAEKLAAF